MPPLLVVIDSDPATAQRLAADLLRRYRADYDAVTATGYDEAVETLAALRAADREVALVVAEQWLAAEHTGAQLLATSKEIHPDAQRCLLIDYGDARCIEPIVAGMGRGYLEHYLTKPWQPLEHLLYPVVAEALEAWARRHAPPFELVRIVGRRLDPIAHELREALTRNGVPYTFLDEHSPRGAELLAGVPARNPDLPVLFLRDGRVLTDYTRAEVAEAMGAHTSPQRSSYDLVVVGAGPAGLAAAVYGASEGLSTLVVERQAMGGQAGTSSRIRNYLGFPRGIPGQDLAARAFDQAWMLGAEFLFINGAAGLAREDEGTLVRLADGATTHAAAVVLATGVSYRRLGVPALEALIGTGVYYGSAVSEAPALRGGEVYIVGAGNSAGQAAIYLARFARRVTLVVRGDSLARSMSDYLIKEIAAVSTIEVALRTEVVDGGGAGRLQRLVLRERGSDERRAVEATGLFVMIGAVPDTDWLADQLVLDDHGFIRTGAQAVTEQDSTSDRLPLETSRSGVFAVGDVRAGSVKRVATAVGEGSTAIQQVHSYLATRRSRQV